MLTYSTIILLQTGYVKYPISEVVQERNQEETKKTMAQAAAQGAMVQGIKGPSPLINLQHFDTIWSYSPDYMHCVLLGVTRQFADKWLRELLSQV